MRVPSQASCCTHALHEKHEWGGGRKEGKTQKQHKTKTNTKPNHNRNKALFHIWSHTPLYGSASLRVSCFRRQFSKLPPLLHGAIRAYKYSCASTGSFSFSPPRERMSMVSNSRQRDISELLKDRLLSVFFT